MYHIMGDRACGTSFIIRRNQTKKKKKKLARNMNIFQGDFRYAALQKNRSLAFVDVLQVQ